MTTRPEPISLGDRRVGPGEPVLVIAEAGVNHNGDLGLARELVDAAAATGADAVKFQAFKAERVAAANSPKAGYQRDDHRPGRVSARDAPRPGAGR